MSTYEPTLESLSQYTVPEWYKDAKFGIYTHWGPYAVPAFGNEWYPRNMYLRDNPAFQHHRKVWGEQSTFGYKDFIPMFTAAKWDPQQWADLFLRAGAKFAGPVVEHHDGFPMYDCEYTTFNCVRMGPKRDITAEQKAAFEAVGMKFVATSHRAQNHRHFHFEGGFDNMDPQYKDLYWKPGGDQRNNTDPEFLEDWLGRTKEVIDKYEPDVLWFDFGWHRKEFLPYRLELVSYYYNRAEEWGREVVMNYKDHVFDGAAVYNIERGKLAGIREGFWQTDTSISTKSWGFVENESFKSATVVIHDLIDIVSKNGNMLLNVGPRPDGTIPPEAEGLLLAIGEWLGVNGEAIYGTRPWEKFGEGPTLVKSGHHSERDNKPFTYEDFRFTRKANALYAIAMGWPGRKTKICSLASGCGIKPEQIQAVTMLGKKDALPWSQDHEGLHVTLPALKPCDHAYTIKIALG